MCKRLSFAAAAAVMASGVMVAGAGSASAGVTWESQPRDTSGVTWELRPSLPTAPIVFQVRGVTWE